MSPLQFVTIISLFSVCLASDIEDLCDSDDPTVKRICQYFLVNGQERQKPTPAPASDDLAPKLGQTIVQLSQTAVQSLQSLNELKQVTPTDQPADELAPDCCTGPVDITSFETRINVSLAAHQQQINVQSEKTDQLASFSEELTSRLLELEQSVKLLQQQSPCSCPSSEPQRVPSSTKGEDFMDADLSVRQDLMKVQYELKQSSEKLHSSLQSKTKEMERTMSSMQSEFSALVQQQESKIEAQASQMGQMKSQLLDQLSSIRHYFMKTVTDFYERMLERQNVMNQRLSTVTNDLSAVKHRVRHSSKSSASNGAGSLTDDDADE